MEFLDPILDEYVVAHTEEEPSLLAQLNRETYAKVLIPRMLAGHFQGRVLSMLSHMIKPKTILEIGTYTGYSALCFAEGLAEGGVIHTIDINEELADMQQRYFSASEYGGMIKTHVGNAVDIIPQIDADFDLVYIDADKENYCNYFDMVVDRVPKGGYIIADNVLWSGKVTSSPEKGDEETEMLQRYNLKVLEDERVQNVLFPIRDGLMIARKK